MTLKLKASAFAVAAAVSLGAASSAVSAQEQRFVRAHVERDHAGVVIKAAIGCLVAQPPVARING